MTSRLLGVQRGRALDGVADPVTWSAAQLAAFTDLYDGSNRPVQPLNDRVELVDSAAD